MRKEEFLQTLRRSLTGNVPAGVIEENIRYYDGYISGEVLKGRTEEEVIEEIGDPRLTARTIMDAAGVSEGAPYRDSYEYGDEAEQGSRGYGQNPYETGRSFRVLNLNKWYWKVLPFVILFGVLYLLAIVIGGIFSLLAPFIWPLIWIWLIVTIVRNIWRK